MSQKPVDPESNLMDHQCVVIETYCKKFTDDLYKELLVFFLTETELCDTKDNFLLEFDDLVKYYLTRVKYPRSNTSPKYDSWKRLVNTIWNR